MVLKPKPVIIPIASGKGGVGKSLFAASLAIALARRGHATIAVDLDLGGSNLHTYLGLANTNPGVGDFLKRGLNDLQQLMVPSGIDNLRFLPGDGKTPFMANIPGRQRLLLLEELQRLPADYVIVDLGAGSSLNTMNFFGLTARGVIITTLDTPAMMNGLVFLRNFAFATIVSLARGRKDVQKMLLDAYRQPADRENLTADALYRRIEELDGRLAREVRQRMQRYRPRFVFNMGDHPEELKVASRIEATLRKSLSMKSEVLGFIYYDDAVRKAVRQNRVFLPAHAASLYARCLDDIVGRITAPASTPAPSLATLVAEAAAKRPAGS